MARPTPGSARGPPRCDRPGRPRAGRPEALHGRASQGRTAPRSALPLPVPHWALRRHRPGGQPAARRRRNPVWQGTRMTDRDREFQALYQEQRIEDQQQYYEDRCAEYEAAHRQTVVVRNTLLVLAALGSIAGQFTGPTVRGPLAVAVTGFEALIGFPQLAKLYTDAARNLAVAHIDWTTRAPNADLRSDLDRVEEIFTKEIGQWGQLVSEAAAAAKTAGRQELQVQPTADRTEPP